MRVRANQDIRQYAKEKKVFLWEIGEALGINAFSITRRLRRELRAEEKERVMQIIDEIASREE
jgi:hypothetical protein